MVVICFKIGISNVMIRMEMGKYQILYDQPKQTALLLIQELNRYRLWAKVLCT